METQQHFNRLALVNLTIILSGQDKPLIPHPVADRDTTITSYDVFRKQRAEIKRARKSLLRLAYSDGAV